MSDPLHGTTGINRKQRGKAWLCRATSVSKKASQSFSLASEKSIKSFSPAACTSEKTLLSSEVCKLSAVSGQRVRARSCISLRQESPQDFFDGLTARQSLALPRCCIIPGSGTGSPLSPLSADCRKPRQGCPVHKSRRRSCRRHVCSHRGRTPSRGSPPAWSYRSRPGAA